MPTAGTPTISSPMTTNTMISDVIREIVLLKENMSKVPLQKRGDKVYS
jgi:hypothetical protein